jgi:hypothetical protein
MMQAMSLPGPLIVSALNSRYFTVASGDTAEQRAIYLTGSHIWNNFHDGMGPGAACPEAPEEFDYDAYLAFLKQHSHNFIRLWRWEQFKSQAAGGTYHLCMTPQPWARTGPGMATDGKPMFDLSQFNPAYFQRLRERVIAAGNAGIYVAVMLFDGFALHLSPAPDNIQGHPFYRANNINGININSIVDYQVLPLDGRVQELQEVYIRKVVDTMHDLPNVLYEVANESSGGGSVDTSFAEALGLGERPDWGDSTEWQYWVITTLKQYEQQMGYAKHPVGMTMQFPVADQRTVNEVLFTSPADWISPGYDDEIFAAGGHPNAPGGPASRWFENPPASDGRKVIISDTDHYAAGKDDALWAWKSFLRGHHPILMDFGLIDGVHPPDPTVGFAPYAAFEPVRYAMGDTLRLAERMQLLALEPRGELSSTGYVLANPGQEYLVLQPEQTAEPFTVTLVPGTYTVEWYSVTRRETVAADRLTVEEGGTISLRAPFEAAAPAIVYLRKG